MDLSSAQNTFAIRLYEWSLRDFQREVDEGCPNLSLVGLNNRTVAAFVEWVKTMDQKQRETVVKAFTHRAHAHAASLRGERFGDRDYWNHEFYVQTSTRGYYLPPLSTADRRLPSFRPINPDHCLDALLSSLTPVLGKASRVGRSGVRAVRHVGDWKIITEFKFIRRDEYLLYEYQFVRKDGKPVIGIHGPFPRRGLFWLYGVSDTLVSVPSEADSEPMAKAMATLAEYFVAQAESLFVGLDLLD